jgi:hypothetical protein
MKSEQMIEALEAAAAKLGVRVRYEPLPPGGVLSGGGLCRVRGEWHLIIDKKSSPADRAAILADALADFDLAAVELPAKLRQMLEARRAQSHGTAASVSADDVVGGE